jgi:hypothetical protein
MTVSDAEAKLKEFVAKFEPQHQALIRAVRRTMRRRFPTAHDPTGVLLGSGNQTRFIRIESSDVLELPNVQALINAAEAQSKTPFRENGRGGLVIRFVSAKQRPRRKTPK